MINFLRWRSICRNFKSRFTTIYIAVKADIYYSMQRLKTFSWIFYFQTVFLSCHLIFSKQKRRLRCTWLFRLTVWLFFSRQRKIACAYRWTLDEYKNGSIGVNWHSGEDNILELGETGSKNATRRQKPSCQQDYVWYAVSENHRYFASTSVYECTLPCSWRLGISYHLIRYKHYAEWLYSRIQENAWLKSWRVCISTIAINPPFLLSTVCRV